ncbi:MAG: helix-turn-helix domain-containing protein [Chitinophagaceae bacterium]|nr:helix-turn-helix domain-containing protein [Chitinophagaceae bacterium]
MKRVSILVPESSVMQAIADPQYLFTAVNQFMLANGKQPLFEVELVAARREVELNNGLFTVHADRLLKEVKKTDLVFIPALFGDMQDCLEKNKQLIPWIQDQYHRGAELASLCVGAFLLASTGLLNGKRCSTHWGFQQEFKKQFPEVEVVEGNIVTEENGIYSSGGAHSYWNLLLHLVEKYSNRETAILASKYFAIDIDRDSQAAFAMFNGQKEHGDTEIRRVQEYIEKHINDRIGIEELAGLVHLGRRTFERRFKAATHHAVLDYIQRVKMEAAKRKFESSRKNINEVMFDVGYTDTKAFRSVFKRITGLTPVEYRNKYNKMAMA